MDGGKSKRRPSLLVLHGPNLNLLGERDVPLYGSATLAEVDDELRACARAAGVDLEILQSNHEGALIDAVQAARGRHQAIIINAGGYAHTSVALRDAIEAAGVPAVEVHVTNIHARESFRRRSLLAPVCVGQIVGFGTLGYRLALEGVLTSLLRLRKVAA